MLKSWLELVIVDPLQQDSFNNDGVRLIIHGLGGVSLSTSVRMRKEAVRKTSGKASSQAQGWLLLLPTVFLLVLLVAYPIGFAFYLSTRDLYLLRDFTASTFIGLKNFIDFLSNPETLRVLCQHTLVGSWYHPWRASCCVRCGAATQPILSRKRFGTRTDTGSLGSATGCSGSHPGVGFLMVNGES